MEFDLLNLDNNLLKGIQEAGFKYLTPVQEAALPVTLSGKDAAVQAQTGTGKTAAFLITIFNRLKPITEHAEGRAPRALVIAPTRELAVQILEDAKTLGGHTGLKMLAVYGGVDYQKQKDDLDKGVDLLVGTPGRLIDYFKQKALSLKYIEIAVVDEADRMFDMGFIADIRYMLRRMPPFDKRQAMLFSATLSFRVMELAYEHMNNPVKIEITPEQVTVDKVEQSLFHVGRQEKFSLLLGLLKKENPPRSMMFVNTKREAEKLVERLNRNGYPADMISGDIPQKKRLRILTEFKAGVLPILIGTDVASRGLHVEGVTHVFNYDLPQDPEDYVHRIGRTARAGATGKAYSFADEQYVFGLEPIEKYIGMKIPVAWPDEDMFAKEKRRTPEEKKASEERDRVRREERAMLEARRGGRGGRAPARGDGRGGPGGRGGRPPERSGGRPGSRPSRGPSDRPVGRLPEKPEAAHAANPGTAEGQPSSPTNPTKKPSRRRRHPKPPENSTPT
jgi:ATP-dependent RNA helicase RhlB